MVFKSERLKFIFAILILTLIVTGGLSFVSHSQAQSGRSFEEKADTNLKRVFQLFRRQPGATPTLSRQQEQEALKTRLGLEERPTGTAIGVIIRLREDSDRAQAAIEAAGFRVRARIGNIAVATVLVDDLPRLAEVESITALEASRISYPRELRDSRLGQFSRKELRAMNDAANAAVKAPEARTTYNVTGRGVVVGIIDSGIDWKHGDFRKADGTTRIKFLWDMSDSAGTGPGNLGRVYTETEINNALQSGSGVDERDLNNHGTHVTGTAAGNGLGAGSGTTPGTYAGIAPEADLVIVKGTRRTDNQSGFRDDDQIAALQWIAARAAELNEPFVINMSLGGHASQHDGTDGVEVAIDNLLNAGPGRQVVIAAGNEGGDPIHTGGVIAQGAEVTIPFTLTAQANAIGAIYNGKDEISAKVIKPDGTILGPIPFGSSSTSDLDVDIENSPGNNGSNARGILLSFKNHPSGTWRLVLIGTNIKNGRYDVWSVDDGGAQLDSSVLDGLQHVGSPAVSKRGIAVANFVSKTQYTDSNGAVQNRTDQGSIGEGAASSSPGPSRDGRIKPEIAAPGSYVMSTYSADTTPAINPSDLAPGGKHNVYFGTSMATPVVTGTVALMLQANRNLTSDQIKRILLRTVTNDRSTGPSISTKFGFGKLSALAAVKAVVDNVYAAEFVSVSAASYGPDLVAAPETIMAGFGVNLAANVAAATSTPLPTTLGEVSVRVTDSTGAQRLAGLFFVSPNQINYTIPAGTAPGVALIDVLRGGNVIARGSVSVNSVWPGLFTLNASGTGTGAAVIYRYRGGQLVGIEPVTNPIDLSVQGDTVFLVLYGTGLRGRSDLSRVRITLGGTPLTPAYVGPQGGFVGLDQINLELPSSLAGRGQLDLLMYVDGWVANTIQFTIK